MQNYLNTATNFLTQTVGQPFTYTGPVAAGPSAGQLEALNMFQTGAEATQPLLPQGLAGLYGGIQGLTSLGATAAPATDVGLATLGTTAAGGSLPGVNPVLQQIVQGIQGVTQNQLDQEMQQINSQMGPIGQATGSPLLDVKSRVLGQVEPGLESTIGQLLLGEYNQQQQEQLTAANELMGYGPNVLNALISAGGSVTGVPFTTAQQYLSASGVPQQAAQEQAKASYQSYFDAINNMFRSTQQGFPTTAGLTSPVAQQYSPPGIVGLLGGALNLFGGPITKGLGLA
jgi:hypothetical protein